MSQKGSQVNSTDPSNSSQNTGPNTKPDDQTVDQPKRSILSRFNPFSSAKKDKKESQGATPPTQQSSPVITMENHPHIVNPNISKTGVSFSADHVQPPAPAPTPPGSPTPPPTLTTEDKLKTPVCLDPDIYDQNEFHFRHNIPKFSSSDHDEDQDHNTTPLTTVSKGSSNIDQTKDDVNHIYRRLVNTIPFINHVQIPIPKVLKQARDLAANLHKEKLQKDITAIRRKIEQLSKIIQTCDASLDHFRQSQEKGEYDVIIQRYEGEGLTVNLFQTLQDAFDEYLEQLALKYPDTSQDHIRKDHIVCQLNILHKNAQTGHKNITNHKFSVDLVEILLTNPSEAMLRGIQLLSIDDFEHVKTTTLETIQSLQEDQQEVQQTILKLSPSYRYITADILNRSLNNHPQMNQLDRYSIAYYQSPQSANNTIANNAAMKRYIASLQQKEQQQPQQQQQQQNNDDGSDNNAMNSGVTTDEIFNTPVPLDLIIAQQSAGFGIFFSPLVPDYTFSNDVVIEFVPRHDGVLQQHDNSSTDNDSDNDDDAQQSTETDASTSTSTIHTKLPQKSLQFTSNIDKALLYFNGDHSHVKPPTITTTTSAGDKQQDGDVVDNNNTANDDIENIKQHAQQSLDKEELKQPPPYDNNQTDHDDKTKENSTATISDGNEIYPYWLNVHTVMNSSQSSSNPYGNIGTLGGGTGSGYGLSNRLQLPPSILSEPKNAPYKADSGSRFSGVGQHNTIPSGIDQFKTVGHRNLDFFLKLIQQLDDDDEYIVLRLYFDNTREIIRQLLQSLQQSSKEYHGLCGLINQGATCYMNSYLQSLFHIPLFRKTLYYLPNCDVPKMCHRLQLAHVTKTEHSVDNHKNQTTTTTTTTEIIPTLDNVKINNDVVLDHDDLVADIHNDEHWVNPFEIYKQHSDPSYRSKHDISFREYLFHKGIIGKNVVIPGVTTNSGSDGDDKQQQQDNNGDQTTQTTTDDNKTKTAIVEIQPQEIVTRTTTKITTPLQQLFYQMQTKGKIDPRDTCEKTNDLTTAFGWHRNQVYEQQDIQEFARKLMDSLEKSMANTIVESATTRLFQGQLENVIECINVDYIRVRPETYEDIMLQVVGCKDLQESLQQYCHVEILDGDNQYRTDDHGKQDVRKFIRLTKQLPPILTLVLKRMEFDREIFEMRKVNDYFEFPLELNMADYVSTSPTPTSTDSSDTTTTTSSSSGAVNGTPTCHKDIRRQQQEQREADLQEHGLNLTAYKDARYVDQSIDCPVHGDTSLMYDLCAVVVHMGHLDGGHYINYVRPVLPHDPTTPSAAAAAIAACLPQHGDVDYSDIISDEDKTKLDQFLAMANKDKQLQQQQQQSAANENDNNNSNNDGDDMSTYDSLSQQQLKELGCICPFDHSRTFEYRRSAKWYRCDDDVITECSKEEAVDMNFGDRDKRSIGKSAYMLFYIRRQYTYYDELSNNGDELIFHPAALTKTGNERIPGYAPSKELLKQHIQLITDAMDDQQQAGDAITTTTDAGATNANGKQDNATTTTPSPSISPNGGVSNNKQKVYTAHDVYKLLLKHREKYANTPPKIRQQLEIQPPLVLLRTLNEANEARAAARRQQQALRQQQRQQLHHQPQHSQPGHGYGYPPPY